MFASVWQLLSFAFVASVLVKLAYKLVSERRLTRQQQQQQRARPVQVQLGLELELGRHLHARQQQFALVQPAGGANLRDQRQQEPQHQQHHQQQRELEPSGSRNGPELASCATRRLNSNSSGNSDQQQQRRPTAAPQAAPTRKPVAPVTRLSFTCNASHSSPAHSGGGQRATKPAPRGFAAAAVSAAAGTLTEAGSVLLLPQRLLVFLVSRSLGFVCALLDAIEGIEAPLGDQTSDSAAAAARQRRRRPAAGSNYFDRRYTSRKSLSEALCELHPLEASWCSSASESSSSDNQINQFELGQTAPATVG